MKIMDENIDNVVAKGSKKELRKNALGGELIDVSLYVEFRDIVFSISIIPFFKP